MSFDGTNMTVYLDGVPVGSNADAGVLSTDIYLAGPDRAGRWE